MPKLLRLPLPRRSARHLARGVCALFFSASVSAQVLQSWQFNDPAGTPLANAANSVPGGVPFDTSFPDVATNGSGQLVIAYNSDASARSYADIPDVSTGKLQLDVLVAGWNFENLIGLGPLLEVGFANTTVGGNASIRTAHIYFEPEVDGSIGINGSILAGVAGSTGGDGVSLASSTPAAEDILFGVVQTTPVTFRLVVDFDTLSYAVSSSADGFAAQATGTIASGKAARFVTVRVLDDFTVGGTGGHFTIDSITLTRLGEAPVLTPLEAWRVLHFETAVNSGLAADDADPDGDGIPNLLEYATGTLPTAANSASPITLGQDSNGRLTVAFTSIADPALTYQLLASEDLQTPAPWPSIVSATGTQLGAGPQVFTDTQPASAFARRFLQLSVTR